MSLASRNRHRVINGSRPDRDISSGRRAVAKLPVTVVSPSPNRPIGFQCETKILTRSNCRDPA